MGRVAAALAVLLALTGCSASTAPQAGPDAEQLAKYRDYVVDNLWAGTGLSDDLRPPLPSVTVLGVEDWADAYVKCMNIAGFDQYRAGAGGSFTIVGGAPMTSRPPDELIADYICNASFEYEGRYDGLYSTAQIDYIFEYFQQELVPCLEVRGLEVVDAPTREEFAENGGTWHPYFGVEESQQRSMIDDPTVLDECPPTPAGIPDPGYALLWQQ